MRSKTDNVKLIAYNDEQNPKSIKSKVRKLIKSESLHLHVIPVIVNNIGDRITACTVPGQSS